jgi:hypothetical protein
MTATDGCAHFQTRIEKLPLELTTALLPIRRCLLAERLVRLLRNNPEAAAIVETFVRDPDSEVPYCICGPDFDTIEHGKCVKTRCRSSCIPAYREILQGLGVEDTYEIDCEEPAPADAAI